MNSKDRQYWYPLIVEKQHGEYCMGCGISRVFLPRYKLKGKFSLLHSKQVRDFLTPILYIDHIDNDNSHNELSNFQLLCPSCNKIKNPTLKVELPYRPFTPEMAKNTKFEKKWRKWINDVVIEKGGLPIEEAIDGGAEKFGLSPETTRKYVKKIISDEGNYGIFDDSIVFKKDIPILEEEKAKKEQEYNIRHGNLVDYSKGKPEEN